MEQRKQERIEVEIEIRVNWPEQRKEVTTTFNYSDGGILASNPFSDIPAVGTPMTLQVTRLVNGKEAPVLPAIVVRATKDQIAFKFTFDNG
jgi:PilZ domain